MILSADSDGLWCTNLVDDNYCYSWYNYLVKRHRKFSSDVLFVEKARGRLEVWGTAY
jgi:hypothetical protein